MLCIVGCTRSGSRYTARLMMRAGIEIGHEKMGNEGIAHPYWAVDDTLSPLPWKLHEKIKAAGKNRDSYRWTHRWHQTRHPLGAIASMRAIHFRRHPYFWQWQERHTGIAEEDPNREIRFWLTWTKISDEWCDYRYRVEDLASEWEGLVARIGHEGAPFRPEGLENCNGIPHESIGWKDLGPWEKPVRIRAKEYGYEE